MKLHIFYLLYFLLTLSIFINLINCENKNEDENDEKETESFCEREGQTICQAFCSPVSFKKCKKNITSQNYDYCCTCQFWEGEFKYQCIPVSQLESES